MQWTLVEARKDFERGLLTGFEIHDSSPILSNEQLWSITLSAKIGGPGALVDTREKTPRQFRNLDSVITTLRSIGFRAQLLQGK